MGGVAVRADQRFAWDAETLQMHLMCMGMASMLAAQVIINIGMVLQWLPVIGITLPFFSAGGSSNLCVYIGIGLMMSIYRFNQKTPVANFRLQRVVTRFST